MSGDAAPRQSGGPPGLFITGTGTEVGKTYTACMIARELAAVGRRVGVYKPVASGCVASEAGLVCEDALQLWEAAGKPSTIDQVCPQSFRAPLAPYLAARAEGRKIDRAMLTAGVDYWRESSEIVLVEGAGGLMSPLDVGLFNADLAVQLGYPLLIVAANELGVINATLQTLIAARSRCPDLPVAGVVLCATRASADDLSRASNATELLAHDVPLLAIAAHGEGRLDRAVDWYALAGNG
ncbi:MAG: dethiobiotin synthase [Pirellulales bacterium]